MIDDLLYRWENSSERRKIRLQPLMIDEYEKASYRARKAIRSRINDYYKISGEGLTFYEVLLGLEQILKEKELEKVKGEHPLP